MRYSQKAASLLGFCGHRGRILQTVKQCRAKKARRLSTLKARTHIHSESVAMCQPFRVVTAVCLCLVAAMADAGGSLAAERTTEKKIGKEPGKRPNILWIMLDDCRADALSCYGQPWAKTPNFDSIAYLEFIENDLANVTPADAWTKWHMYYRPMAHRGFMVLEAGHRAQIEAQISRAKSFRRTLWGITAVFVIAAAAAALWPRPQTRRREPV